MKKIIHKYWRVILLAILAFAFFSRIYRVHIPERYIFDEVYHALTAKLIARNDTRAYEWWNPPVEKDTAVDWLHPPLAKYTQALGILAFGENTFGWRISSVIFGVLVIVAVYILSELLFRDKRLSLLAAFLTSLDGLLLVQSRIAMNDIHVTFFILLTLIMYIKHKKQKDILISGWLFASGVSAGLAMGTKWSGLFSLIIIGVFEAVSLGKQILRFIKDKIDNNKNQSYTFLELFLKIAFSGLSLAIVPILVYILSYSHMFLQGKTLICTKQEYIQGKCYFERGTIFNPNKEFYGSHFFELHRQIWSYQTGLEATHPAQSRPYQWFFNLKPVWVAVDYSNKTKIANTYAFGNPALFWIGDIAIGVTLLYFTRLFFLQVSKRFHQHFLTKHKQSKKKTQIESTLYPQFNIWFLTVSYFMVWLPWQVSPRIMFFYHYAPAVPLLSIILAYWLLRVIDPSVITYNCLTNQSDILVAHEKNKSSKKAKPNKLKYPLARNYFFIFVVLTIFITYLIWYPHWSTLPVPKWFAESVYFALDSWR